METEVTRSLKQESCDFSRGRFNIKRIKAIDIAQEALWQCGADIPKGA